MTPWLSPLWLDLSLGGVAGSLLGMLSLPLVAKPWWQEFPWGAVGATVAIIGLLIAALKLAVMWGGEKQKNLEQDRRLDAQDRRIEGLEARANGVPDAVDDGVSKRYAAVESEASALRRHLARAVADLRRYGQDIDHLKWRCETNHGPLSKVTSVREDSDELLLEPPQAAGDKDDAAKG